MKIQAATAAKSHYWPMVLFVALMSIVRVVYLSADAPTTLTWSAAPFTDEGRWSHSAVNKALFGKWIVDEFNPIFYTPLFTLLQFIVFECFGVSLASARLGGAVLGALTPLLLFGVVKEWFSRKTAWLAAIFLGANYAFIMHNRLALLETPMVFLLVAVLYFWQRGIRRGDYNFVLAGLAMLAAFLVKTSSLFIVPAYLFASLRAKRAGSIRYFLAGFLGPLVLFLLVWRNPDYMMLKDTQLAFFPNFRLALIEDLQAVVTFCGSDFFGKMPIVSGLALLYVAAAFSPHRTSRLNALEVFTVSWLVVGSAVLILYRYQPSRYFLILAPPMCIACAVFLADVAGKALVVRRVCVWYALPWLAVFTVGICFHLLRATNRIAIESVNESRHNFAVAFFLLMGAGTAALFIFKAIARNGFRVSSKVTLAFAAAAVLLSFGIQAYQYLRWAYDPKYSIVKAARQVKDIVPNDAVLTGDVASTLALENRLFTVIFTPRNSLAEADKFGITHVIWEEKIFRRQIRRYPLYKVVILQKIQIMDNYYRNRMSGYKPQSYYLYRLLPRKRDKKP